ncbi:iron transporter [Orientia tsutsugamushi]|uniref:NifU family protein n=1 Tax=Orientia tsutsugamushi TaxID=784 RepID=UPI0005F92E94|nr:NifU family protein [Orientia tsutsugamushi]KJV74897.1 scaffold Nfu/NifU N terminal family protein [Orientia tsutsugamushi str. TA763]SPP25310.1 iron transporter [Orientia tsutsugamushi]
MFIQTQQTPNPNSLKFFPDQKISPGNPVHFSTREECTHSILARKLFSIENVKEVFFGEDFITVTKVSDGSWEVIKPEILTMLMDHFVAGLPIFESDAEKKNIEQANLSEIEKQIIEIINTKVRPAVAMDGGDIEYHSFKDGIVKLQMRGACVGCPSSTMTLKQGIESLLKYYIPEVVSVEQV